MGSELRAESWESFILKVVKDNPQGMSDIIIRDTGEAWIIKNSLVKVLPLPPELAGEHFTDLVMMVATTAQVDGKKVWEGAATIGPYRFRLSLSQYAQGREMVMRILPSIIPTIESICLPQSLVDYVSKLKFGLVLAVGSTGSGKSTSLAALLQHFGDLAPRRFITLEDPIEYLYSSHGRSTFTQREVGKHVDSFGDGLKRALRQIPFGIMVGEIRDGDTADIALRAATSGHVVFSTMHTDTPAQAVAYFLKMLPHERQEAGRHEMAHVLRACWAQRLVLNPETDKRCAIHEVMLWDEGIANNIRKSEFHIIPGQIDSGQQKGMMTFRHSMARRVEEGLLPSSLLEE